MNPRSVFALVLGGGHLVLVLGAESLRRSGALAGVDADIWLALPLSHFEAWIAGLLVYLLATGASRVGAAALVWAFAAAAGLYVVLAAPAARYFGYFPGIDLVRDGLSSSHVIDSALAELSGGFWLLALLWLLIHAVAAVLLGPLRGKPTPRGLPPERVARPPLNRERGALILLAGGVLIAMSIRSIDVLPEHPLRALLVRAAPGVPRLSSAPTGEAAASAFVPLRYGRYEEATTQRETLGKVGRALDGRQPNVVFVVLESVAAAQLITGGRIDPEVAPNLRRLHDAGGVLFDSVIVNYPATLRSNIALNTAGRFPTWMTSQDAVAHRWRGPLMARDFAGAGYRTGLFASPDLDFLALSRFLRQADYGTFVHFGSLPPATQDAERLNSWGGRGDRMILRAVDWLDPEDRRPFFLHYMTNAPHHPYDVPEGEAAQEARSADSRQARYRRALAYADSTLGTLIDALEARGLRDNTLIVVTGDHGEAFGADGRHRARAFDDAIRGFALFALPPGRTTPLVSHRIIANADLFPTAAAIAGVGQWRGHWRDALAPGWQPRIQFFQHENAAGGWGLRDGRWKFVSRSQGKARLFDLETDPRETRDLAGEPGFSRQLRQYDAMAVRWFLERDRSFAAALEALPTPPVLKAADLDTFGLKHLAVGRVVGNSDISFDLQRATVLHPRELVMIDALWAGFPALREVEYRWRGPDGQTLVQKALVSPALRAQRLPAALPRPLVAGRWTLSVWLDDRTLGEVGFDVRADAPLGFAGAPAELAPKARPELVSIAVGAVGVGHGFTPVKVLKPSDAFTIRSHWRPGLVDSTFRYVLVSPRREALPIPVWLPAGGIDLDETIQPPVPLWEGRWRVELQGERGVMSFAEFEVRP